MTISAAIVKELREKTGVGMMDCKRALEETDGNLEKAMEVLRKKGLAAVAKRAGRVTSEGVIASYIHPGERLGVLVEVNCETDFVARTPDFRAFVKEIAMQVAAANPLVMRREDLLAEDVEREKEIYRDQARSQGKPDTIIEKIVQGKMEKYYQEVCLLDQQFIKDSDKRVSDLLNDVKMKLGENIIIKRFARFRLGE
ncbi:MAG: elongation factor Ts [candidate division Zixibacteria bacterium SM23_81]|nr:MAG: elongation factor Ts [candidate division Zixibacteria bacterium SM23_81]